MRYLRSAYYQHIVLVVNSNALGKLIECIHFLQVKSKLKGHSKRITGLAFSNILNVLVSSGADAQVDTLINVSDRMPDFVVM